MRKILVTGAAGFLGFHLAEALSNNAENRVVCVDNFVRGDRDAYYLNLLKRSNVEALNINLNDEAEVQQLPDDCDYVYHLAALNGTQNFYERPVEVLRCCTLPTLFLTEKFGRIGRVKRFIYAGTSESYASTVSRFGWAVPTSEDVPLGIDDVFNPRWSYAAGKMHGEVATAQAGRHYGMDISIVRYHNAYGPRMGDKHVIPDFLARARKGRFELYGHEDTRSFMYVSDSVRATMLVAETPACANQIINVGGEEEIVIRALGEMIMKIAGFKGNITLHASPTGSVKRRAPDITKLKQLTGFSEQVSLEEGLLRTAKFYLHDCMER